MGEKKVAASVMHNKLPSKKLDEKDMSTIRECLNLVTNHFKCGDDTNEKASDNSDSGSKIKFAMNENEKDVNKINDSNVNLIFNFNFINIV